MTTTIALVISLALALGVGFAGSKSTIKEIPGWYAKLNKPAWNPPNWIFGPVWTILYILMAVAAWLTWKETGFGSVTWVFAYAAQLVLNFLWSHLFFGLHRLDWAFFELTMLWLAILATTVLFWSVVPLAGVLMLPYLAWVSFAGTLNFTVWKLNQHPSQTQPS